MRGNWLEYLLKFVSDFDLIDIINLNSKFKFCYKLIYILINYFYYFYKSRQNKSFWGIK